MYIVVNTFEAMEEVENSEETTSCQVEQIECVHTHKPFEKVNSVNALYCQKWKGASALLLPLILYTALWTKGG